MMGKMPTLLKDLPTSPTVDNPLNAADAASDPAVIARVQATVRAIPAGRVMSYGAVGAHCDPPISGYICGRMMQRSVSEVPWWRVVAKDGALPISKRNPHLAQEQRAHLSEEGVAFETDGRVSPACFVT